MKPVPVLLASHQLGIGGSERQLAEVARALDRRRFAPHVAAFHAGGIRAKELESAGVPVFELPVRSFRNMTAVRGAKELRRIVEERGIELIHAFDAPLSIFCTVTYAFGNRPVVLTSQRGHRDLTEPLVRRLFPLSDRLTDGIVVNCEYMRRHLTEDYAVAAEKIDLCYNGVDADRFSPGETTRPPSLADAQPLIGAVCALRPEKSLETLIQAVADLRTEFPRVRLALIGSGPEKNRLETLATELGIRNIVHFEPTTSDVTHWLRMLDIFVLPSRSEALSNAILEAMACGACVVASDVGGNPELTRSLFPPGDAVQLAAVLRGLARDPAERAQLARAARQRVLDQFSIAASARRMGDIYEARLEAR